MNNSNKWLRAEQGSAVVQLSASFPFRGRYVLSARRADGLHGLISGDSRSLLLLLLLTQEQEFVIVFSGL